MAASVRLYMGLYVSVHVWRISQWIDWDLGGMNQWLQCADVFGRLSDSVCVRFLVPLFDCDSI